MGAKLLVEVASKTDQKAGDGTTTSTVLTQALVTEGLKLVASGANPIALQRGLQKASKLLAAEIKVMAKPVSSDDDIKNIAIIATGSEAMGRTISTCFNRVGANGATMVEDGQTLTDEIDFTEVRFLLECLRISPSVAPSLLLLHLPMPLTTLSHNPPSRLPRFRLPLPSSPPPPHSSTQQPAAI